MKNFGCITKTATVCRRRSLIASPESDDEEHFQKKQRRRYERDVGRLNCRAFGGQKDEAQRQSDEAALQAALREAAVLGKPTIQPPLVADVGGVMCCDGWGCICFFFVCKCV